MALRAFSPFVVIVAVWIFSSSWASAGETILSTILTPNDELETDLTSFYRQGRSDYYDQRYGASGQFSDRPAQYDPQRCGRCLDDRYDDREDPYDRPNRDRYDDDRRPYHRPTYGNRHDKNKEGDDDRYNSGRNGSDRKNGTNDEANDDQRDNRPHDNKDDRKHGSGGGGRRDRDRNRYDDRDRYHPDYYDRFLRDPYRDRNPYKDRDPYRERDPYGYEDPYRERRPLFERYPYGESYEDHYDTYRRPVYDNYDRGNGYDDRGYGGRGRGPHDRPWDETYRGQAGWDAAGRGYYFAGGRPDSAPAAAWARPDYRDPYARPDAGGWQNVERPYREGTEYRGTLSYPQDYGYRQELDVSYRPLGWGGYGERRPYRDQTSQVPKGQSLYGQSVYGQGSSYGQGGYEESGGYGQGSYTQSGAYGQGGHAQSAGYGQGGHAQSAGYGQGGHAHLGSYGHGSYGQSGYGQSGSTGASGYGQTSSTTPGTSYLYQREDELVTKDEVSTKPPSQ